MAAIREHQPCLRIVPPPGSTSKRVTWFDDLPGGPGKVSAAKPLGVAVLLTKVLNLGGL